MPTLPRTIGSSALFLSVCLLAAIFVACSGGGVVQGDGPGAVPLPPIDFTVVNHHAQPRTETFVVSVPFPEHVCRSTEDLAVVGFETTWLTLQYWADGSVKVAQAQFTDTLAGLATKKYKVWRGTPMPRAPFHRHPWVPHPGSELRFGAEVVDAYQVPYRGFATGDGTVLQSTPLVQTTRWRTYHTAAPALPGIGRDYLTSTFYVTEFRDVPIVIVDWILGNDYLGADSIPPNSVDPNLHALGPVDVERATFLSRGASAVAAYRQVEEDVAGPFAVPDGLTAFHAMRNTWLGDAQTRRYRFLLRCETPSANRDELDRWRSTTKAMLDEPCHPLATQPAWHASAAAGLLGGPIAGPADSHARAESEYQSWAGSNTFGTWGGHGDGLETGTTGTPRNQPLTQELAHAIQGQHHRLLRKLEQMAWAQAMRPYHLWNLHVSPLQPIILWGGLPLLSVQGESLGRRQLQTADPYAAYRLLSAGQPLAHGWGAYDHEHWTCDLLFDYWTITGDAWAREELRQLGESLKGLLRLQVYYTANIQPARAEGWCMQGFAQVYQATQDDSVKSYAIRRVVEVVDAQRKKNHASRAMTFQSDYPGTGYPLAHEFFMPWQHGAVLWGYLGAYRSFREPLLLHIAEDVVQTVEYSWVHNVTSPTFGWVPDGLRYFVPASHNGQPVLANYWDGLPQGISLGDGPLGGAHIFLAGGLCHLATMTGDPAVSLKALHYGAMLVGPLDTDRWSKWKYCLPASLAQ